MSKKNNTEILSFQELADLLQRQVEYYESVDKKPLTRTKRKYYRKVIALTHVAYYQYLEGVRRKL